MPFLPQGLKQLRKREGLNLREFGESLGKFVKESSLQAPTSYTHQTISNWERNISQPRSMSIIDVLYLYASTRGYSIQFYEPASKTVEKKSL